MKKLLVLLPFALTGCETYQPIYYRYPAAPAPVTQQPWSDGKSATYWVGRSVSPDGNTIHEAHPIYRREVAPQPQLNVSPHVFYPTNLPLPSTNAAFEQFDLLRAEAARARDLTLQLTRASEALAQQASGMKAAAENARQTQEQMRQLLQTSAAFSNRLYQLERQIPTAASNPAARATTDR